MEEKKQDAAKAQTLGIPEKLLRIAHMFGEHRDDKLMRELCRLAIKCAQEGWTTSA